MSTLIKLNDNWVTTADNTRMWVGTKSALATAINNNELDDDTLVMITDDASSEVVKTGVGTRNPDIVSDDNFVAKWVKIGRVCYAEIQMNLLADGNSETLVTGLPTPICQLRFNAQGSTNTETHPLILEVDDRLRIHWTASYGWFYHASFSYITAE